jgi:hypothetical protein
MEKKIKLDFGMFSCTAKLFDTPVARALYESLPHTVSLTTWGDEAYGSIGVNLGEYKPVPAIPPGGLAYTNQGNYICIFYGQTPAWSVEHIGAIEDNAWQNLPGKSLKQVTISAE